MPNQIENFLLGLKFDNAQFERGAAQSMRTLDSLKEKLALKGADSGISNIQKSLSSLSFKVIDNGINTVTQSFSLLEQIGIGAARAIGAQIENLGSKLVKKLGFDQIFTGWQKYGDITQSIQTMMAALPDKTIEEVTEQMEKLNWFSDETSYSLTDMTNNVAKFTSAGIKLEDAVNQMMGIGAAAALAGAGVQNASHAMSGFSKAMAAGYMSTLNWSWIQTSKMDTLAFKGTLLDAATVDKVDKNGEVIKATLKKVGDEYYTVGKNVKVTAEALRDSLSEKWLDRATMETALKVYGDFSDVLNEFYVVTGNGTYYTTSKLLEYIDAFKEGGIETEEFNKILERTGLSSEELTEYLTKLGSAEYETGRKAFAAAQEAISLQQAWDSLSDAVSTGWMRTFQYIFGNYEESKKLWTELANWLYDLFAESGNLRNEVLDEWHFTDSGGYNDFIDGIFNMMDAVSSLKELVTELFGLIIPEIDASTLVKWTLKFNELTGSISDKVADITEKFSLFRNGTLLGSSEEFDATNEAADDLNEITNKVDALTAGITKLSSVDLDGALKKPVRILDNLFDKETIGGHKYNIENYRKSSTGPQVLDILYTRGSTKANIADMNARLKNELFNPMYTLGSTKANIEKYNKAIRDTVSRSNFSLFDTEELDDGIDKLARRFANLDDALLGVQSAVRIVRNAFELLWGSLKTMFAPVKTLGDDFLELFGAVGRRIQDISRQLVGSGVMVRFFRDLGTSGGTVIEKLVAGIHKFVVALTELIDPEVESSTSNFLGTVFDIIKTLWGGIKTIVETFAPMVSSLVSLLKELFGGLAGVFKDFFGEGIKFTDFTNRLKNILDVGILAGIFGLFKKGNSILKQFKGKGIKDIITELINGKDGDKDPLDKIGFIKQIKETATNIGDAFKSFTDKISDSLKKFTETKLLKEFANSILKIAAAMLIIALIPADKFARATITIVGMIGAIIGMMWAFSKLKFEQVKSIAAIGAAISGIGTGLLFLAGAIFVLALVPENKIDQGLHVMTVALLELGVLLYALGSVDAKSMLAAGVSILLIGAAIDLISIGLIALALIPANKLMKSVGVLAAALSAIVVVTLILSKVNFVKMLSIGASVMMFAVAMDAIAVALGILALVPGERLLGGVLALLSVVTVIATAISLMSAAGNGVGVLAAATAMLIMAPAILVFSAALVVLSLVPFLNLAGGLIVLVTALSAIVVAAYAVTPVIPGLLAFGLALIEIGAASVLLAAGLIGISVAIGIVVGIVVGAVLLIIDAIKSFVSIFTGTIEQSKTDAEEGGVAMTNGLLDGLESAFNFNIGDVVKNLVDGFVNKFSIGAIAEKIKGVGRRIWNTLKSGLEKAAGIASPSKEMAKEMGYMIAGLGTGADKNRHILTDIGSNMAQTLLDASDETFAGYEPTLTPVLDLSQAQSGSLSFGASLTPSAARNLASVSADIRDQRESMNDYIDQAVSSAINGMKDQLTFIVPLEVDGRQFAQSTARFTRNELNLIDRNTLRKGGYA